MRWSILYILLVFATGYANNNDLYKTKADFYLHNQNYRDAIKYYTLLENPNFSIFNKIGFAYYSMGQFTKAVPFFQKAISLNTNMSYLYNNLGSSLLKLNQYKKSEFYLRKAIQKKSKYAKAMYNLAVVLFYQRQYRESFSFALKAFKINKKYVKSRFNKDKTLKKIRLMQKKYPQDKELKNIETQLEKLS